MLEKKTKEHILRIDALIEFVNSEDEATIKKECDVILSKAINTYKLMFQRSRNKLYSKKVKSLKAIKEELKLPTTDRTDYKQVLIYGKNMYNTLGGKNI